MGAVLVVDDETDVVEFIAEQLEIAGCPTRKAYDGVDAVMAVLDGGVDAVVMDIRMPKLDGINALRIIRRVAPKVPVIMFTGQAGQGDMIASSRLGAFACLVKPVSMEKLMAALRQVRPATPG